MCGSCVNASPLPEKQHSPWMYAIACPLAIRNSQPPFNSTQSLENCRDTPHLSPKESSDNKSLTNVE
ncbi:hypothetical protein [Rubritalea tangerina]|uniref:hypothetical protein n=1 Tax=Rubritalea tangerina TaxID=430798 RepID=UPI003620E153